MNALDSYTVDLTCMRTDSMKYQFKLGHAFFEAVGGTLIRGGDADAALEVRRTEEGYAFDFHIKGTVQMPCDRCLDDMAVAVDTERTLAVKLGEEYVDDGDAVTLSREDAVMNVAWIMYEYVALEVPLVHVHEPGQCNAGMMEVLAEHLVDTPEGQGRKEDGKDGEEKPADPRWDKLREMLDNN